MEREKKKGSGNRRAISRPPVLHADHQAKEKKSHRGMQQLGTLLAATDCQTAVNRACRPPPTAASRASSLLPLSFLVLSCFAAFFHSLLPSASSPWLGSCSNAAVFRRKYFSSLERLQITEHASISHTSHNLRPVPCRCHSAQNPTVPCTAAKCVRGNQRRRLHKVSPLHESLNAQQDAQWFFSLPDKVRRGFFTREEQVLLANRFEAEFLASSDTTPPKRRSLYSPVWSQEDVVWEPEDEEDEQSSAKSFTFFTPSLASLSTLDLRLDDFTTPRESESKSNDAEEMGSSDPQRPSHGRRVSFRRTLSMTGNPFGRISTSSPPTPASPTFPLQSNHRRTRGSSVALPRTQNENPGPAIDPTAMHYQDPEARMKLRLYLASPQKFDEAVEFGFPSTFDPIMEPPSSSEPITSTANSRLASRDLQAFLRGDSVSFLQSEITESDAEPVDVEDSYEDAEADDLSDVEDDDPVTPRDVAADAFRAHHGPNPSHGHSLDSSGVPIVIPRTRPDQFAQSSACNREMTLRMTLTRPDLRADEEALYGWQRNGKNPNDPLALEELPMTDDMTGLHGAFAVKAKRRSAVNRFLNLVKR